MKRIVLAIGTRPEAIKMGPVFHALAGREGLEPAVLLTGQHREQLAQSLELFKLPVAADMEVMTPRQGLPELASRIVPRAAETLRRLEADYVLVQGDTLTTFAVAWAAFLERIPVGHVEAGLRSHRLDEPFPEEANRRLTGVIADLHLPPTSLARENLVCEGKDSNSIVVTGQTGIDAVLHAAQVGELPAEAAAQPCTVVTLHRRESWGKLSELAGALRRLAEAHPRMTFVYPVHKNPTVREAVEPVLSGLENFRLLEPLEYGAMARLLASSVLIITDSGGLQEEGAAFKVPVVVVRNVTERPEGLEAGILELAGTDPERVFEVSNRLLSEPSARQRMSRAANPYGDGRAAERVAAAVAWRFGLEERPADWTPR